MFGIVRVVYLYVIEFYGCYGIGGYFSNFLGLAWFLCNREYVVMDEVVVCLKG